VADLAALERAAGLAFAAVGMPEVAEDAPPGAATLLEYQDDGRAWVAVDDADRPVAYVVYDVVDGCAHVEQISVHPDWARAGIGRALLDHVSAVAAVHGLEAVTLTAFAHVAWNAPYYQRIGFRPVPDDELTPGLAAIRERESARGLDRWPRVCLRRDVGRD
jgi:GNAT superfamily N-acetyltransferase